MTRRLRWTLVILGAQLPLAVLGKHLAGPFGVFVAVLACNALRIFWAESLRERPRGDTLHPR